MLSIQTQGVAIPRLGFGTFRMPGNGSQPIVECALELGYRHIGLASEKWRAVLNQAACLS
jgi:2,5-diketo-D-gluconate reductase B